jgi:ParB family chromosome partitioning protein
MAQFLVDQSETHKENTALKEQLAAFDGAEPARSLDPTLIKASRWANRIEASFQGASFEQLKTEIQSAGGNVQPIKVRPLAEAGERALYEIVYGHRRHRACLELGLPVIAVIATGLTDQMLYAEMERENRNREDLSPWEQGLMYARALDEGLFPSLRQLAAAIGSDPSNLSKSISLAKLPQQVVAAFASPLDINQKWAPDLKAATQTDPDLAIARAQAIQGLTPRPPAQTIFAMLTAPPGKDPAQSATGAFRWNGPQGKKLATMRADAKGRLILTLAQELDEAGRKEFLKCIDGFFAGSTRSAS